MLRTVDEYFQAIKLYMLKKLSRTLQNQAQRFALWSMRIFWYTYTQENSMDVSNVEVFETAPAVLKANAKRNLKRNGAAKKKRNSH